MANSKAPKHDFAPAWLKIPEQDTLKSGGRKSGEHAEKAGRGHRSSDDYYHRYGPPPPLTAGAPDYYDRRFGGGKFRHHPMEEDYYGQAGNAGYSGGFHGFYNGYYANDKCSQHYRPQYRDKFSSPRYPPQVNGGYPQYYDRYQYDYYAAESGGAYYNNGYNGGGGGGRSTSKRSYGGDREVRSSLREKEKTTDADRGKEDSLEEEFPSLNGDSESSETKAGKPISNSVWDGKPKIGSGRNQGNQVMSKTLLINKSGGTPKKILKSSNIDINSNSSSTKPGITPDKKDGTKEGSPTPPIFVTQPKNLTNKKSEFLKELRRDNYEDDSDLSPKSRKDASKESVHSNGTNGMKCDGEECPVSGESIVNGVHDLSLSSSPNENILSSSLEAEQRLLREMGWSEYDDEAYELTEEERHEMEKLSQEIKKRKEQENGVKKSLPKTWSPQHHMFPHAVVPPPPSDDLSSSDTDSDLDL